MSLFSRDTRCELCCFAASCLALCTFLLAIFALERTLGGATSEALYLLVAAGIAFVLTIVFTAVAVEMERKAPLTGHSTLRSRAQGGDAANHGNGTGTRHTEGA
jgi:hypothetical protein